MSYRVLGKSIYASSLKTWEVMYVVVSEAEEATYGDSLWWRGYPSLCPLIEAEQIMRLLRNSHSFMGLEEHNEELPCGCTVNVLGQRKESCQLWTSEGGER